MPLNTQVASPHNITTTLLISHKCMHRNCCMLHVRCTMLQLAHPQHPEAEPGYYHHPACSTAANTI